MNKLMIVDGNSIVNRAFYGIRLLTNSEGLYTNAVYGFLNILFKYLDTFSPTHLCVAFDVHAPTFRHKEYEGYKAKRKGMPEELRQQMPLLKEVLSAMNIPMLEIAGYEADDIIGTVSRICEEQNIECNILTGDKDDLQLASPLTKILLVTTKLSGNDTTVYDDKGVLEKYGVTPSQFIDVKALMGDPSDNIPGVPGIGEKSAFSLISQYKSLDAVYENIGDLKPAQAKKISENKDMAYLSLRLATIDRNVPMAINIDEYINKEYDNETLLELFKKLNFTGFISRLNISAPMQNCSFEEVSPSQLMEKTGKETAYYLIPSGDIWYLAIDGYCTKVESLNEIAEFFTGDIAKIGHNIKEDIVLLNKHGIEFNNVKYDTALAAYLLDPQRSSYNLEDLATQYLNKSYSGETAIETAASKAEIIKAFYEYSAWEMSKNNMADLYYSIELPLLRVLADMQIYGFSVDQNLLGNFGKFLDTRIGELTETIFDRAGCEFNINSPKQLGEVLFEKMGLPIVKKTKTGYSTGVEVLEKLYDKDEIIPMILEYRQLTKLKSTYVEGLIKVIEDDGRIHSSFNQTVTATGRISSTEPNLQNIPVKTELGREIRKAFVTRGDDYILIDADYSQIELRVLAHISNDQTMIEAFNEGMDIHTKTAAEVFGVYPDFVTGQMRSRAKAVNFGIVYGIGAFSLAQDLKISLKEAKSYIENYLNTYTGVKGYMESIVKEAEENGYVTTLMGRRRYIPEIQGSNKMLKAFGERVAMNAPIQGTAADIIKIAMVKVHNRLKEGGYKSRLILQVHDELIIEAYKPEAEEIKALLKEEMETAWEMSVPLISDVGEGKTWYDAK
ncbi:MAG: DNA polymerase I [Eubacteriales bacterium]|nr:DNA polymerase I [Eubacteriales bacterium]